MADPLNDGSIQISGGDINLGGYDFESLNYQPPSYPRAITLTDVPVVTPDGDSIVMSRTVDDLGPLMPVWKTFTVHCYNADSFDQPEQAWRGELMYQNLLEVFHIVGEPIRLVDNVSRAEYWVMFDASGLTVKYSSTRAAGKDPQTQEPLGPEYEVDLTLFAVPEPED